MNLKLSDFLLLNNTNLPNVVLINANEDYTSAIHYTTCHIKQSINNINLHSFIVDRYFKFDTIYDILNSTSLFDDKNYIELNYKTKPIQEHQTVLKNIYPLLQKSNYLVIITDYLNKREQTSKWVDLINQHGAIVTLNDSILPQLISNILRSYNLNISN
ncbi:MAG: hypothetical protein K2P99_07475, partial [Burkholderiales bacterium]|nr:hypothetical protein [Burkholderiales bacterium]